MVATETRYEHVILDEEGTPVVAGTGFQVELLVLEHLEYGWSPEELCYQHPGLRLGEVHSALAYYWDHREEMDRQMEMHRAEAKRLRREAGASRFARRLKVQGRL